MNKSFICSLILLTTVGFSNPAVANNNKKVTCQELRTNLVKTKNQESTAFRRLQKQRLRLAALYQMNNDGKGTFDKDIKVVRDKISYYSRFLKQIRTTKSSLQRILKSACSK